MFKRRAQSSGPIELVVAVIVMMASMGLAFTVFSSSESAKCINQLHSQVRGVETALIDVALGSPSTTRVVDLELSKCGDLNVEAVRVVYYNKPSFCQRCPSTGKGCWVLEPLTYSAKTQAYAVVGDASTCVNIPGQIELQDDSGASSCNVNNGEGHISGNACPQNPKGEDEGDNCGIPADAIDGPKVLTLSKVSGSERLYKVRISKTYGTAAGVPTLNICFQTKQEAVLQERGLN